MSDLRRFERQLKLDEVGPRGQAALEESRVALALRPGALVAAQYLHRAGVRSVELTSLERPLAMPHAPVFRFGASRRFATGAWTALGAMRRVLGIET